MGKNKHKFYLKKQMCWHERKEVKKFCMMTKEEALDLADENFEEIFRWRWTNEVLDLADENFEEIFRWRWTNEESERKE